MKKCRSWQHSKQYLIPLASDLERRQIESRVRSIEAAATTRRGGAAVQEDGHRIEVSVVCLPARFWKFRIAGPAFQGLVSTGSGSLSDYWWAVKALVQGTVGIICPGPIRCDESGRTYALTGKPPREIESRFRLHLVDGMLAVEPWR